MATGLTLAAWAAMSWFLWISGRWSLHVSSRIFWVIPFGAVVLTVGAIGRLVTARIAEPAPFTARRAWPLAALAVPVVVVLAMPPIDLGAFAAERRGDVAAAAVYDGRRSESGPVNQVDVATAPYSPDVMRALIQRAGEEVSFIGFVTHPEGTLADEFVLNRFVIRCCVDDALNARVRVVDVPPGEYPEGTWLRVTGRIYPVPEEVLLDATKLERVAKPKDPYIQQ